MDQKDNTELKKQIMKLILKKYKDVAQGLHTSDLKQCFTRV